MGTSRNSRTPGSTRSPPSAESGMDVVTQNSVFWVVTDSLRCFY